MQLNAVVLPEPLGPMSAVILRAVTSKEQSVSARTPPNDLCTARTCIERLAASAIGLIPSSTVLLMATRRCRPQPGRWPARDELLRGDEQPVGHEARDQDEHHAEHGKVHLAGDARGQPVDQV